MTAAEQLALNLSPLVEPDYAPKASIQERYEAFIAANPWVLSETERLVADLVDAGQKRIGVKQVWEVIRYGYRRTFSADFKANNDYTSRIARDLIARHPSWADHIETRALRAA